MTVEVLKKKGKWQAIAKINVMVPSYGNSFQGDLHATIYKCDEDGLFYAMNGNLFDDMFLVKGSTASEVIVEAYTYLEAMRADVQAAAEAAAKKAQQEVRKASLVSRPLTDPHQ